MSLVDFFLKNPPTSRTQPSPSDENLRQAQLYNNHALLEIRGGTKEGSYSTTKSLELYQIANLNSQVISAIQDLMVTPKNNEVLKNQDVRAQNWNVLIPNTFESQLSYLEYRKVPKEDPLYERTVCFVTALANDMIYEEKIDSTKLGKLTTMLPSDEPGSSDHVPNCYQDKALSIYDYTLVKSLSTMYKVPNGGGFAFPNPNQATRNNNQPGTYNPNYPNQ
ncbi:hypothetical protein NIES267_64200 [Calothrix parasitica NIES-267]|uniref:Uncharacterized protein n=1 Tax=Calothrix parasitica NIES-267 TaxID=1973488 RepID=A0A1Z4M090_9CYAN|nr:hypothetical protein NIES267_64200 [Calothrix parasitica NIES-267]